MAIRPLHGRVLVRTIEQNERSAGGVIIPDTAKDKPMEGMVLAVGPGRRTETGKVVPMDVKTGDQILFKKFSGSEIRVKGEDLLILSEGDILGVLGP